MYRGEFIGKYAKEQEVRILILGESHHWSADDKNKTEEECQKKASAYTTSNVVKNYLENYDNHIGKDRDCAYRFFDNIVRTFEIDPEEHRTDFWDRVYFGNYIDTLCGVRDNFAKNLLKIEENRKRYNEQLFLFIRENKIDIVFCFSRRAYNCLPTLENNEKEELDEKSDLQRLNKLTYCSGERKNISESLIKPVIIYGLRHPSQYYSYRSYQNKIKVVKEHDFVLNKAIEVFQKAKTMDLTK